MSRKSHRKNRIEAAATTCKPFRIEGVGKPVSIEAQAADATGTLRRASMKAYTGAPMDLSGYKHPVIVDLLGVKARTQTQPLLREHDKNRIVGHSDKITIHPTEGIDVEGPLSGVGVDTPEVIKLADNGFQWQCSIGADPKRMEFLAKGSTTTVNGRRIEGPMLISRETVLGETSFVTNGADGDTAATIAATAFSGEVPMNFAQFCESLGLDADKITAGQKATLMAAWKQLEGDETPTTDDLKAQLKAAATVEINAAKVASREVFAAESRRVAGIQAAVKKHGVSEIEIEGKKVNLELHAIENDWDADKCELHALRAARPGVGVGVPGGLGYMTSTPEVSEAVLECAVLQAGRSALFDSDFYEGQYGDRKGMSARDKRHIKAEMSRYPEKVQDDAHRIFRSRVGLKQMISICARAGGWRGSDNFEADELGVVAEAAMRIRADGSSAMNVANVTANVQNKSMLQGYFYTEQTFRQISPSKSVKDFKATKAINIFGDTIFLELGENGELAHATVKDQAFSNQVRTKGRMLTIPHETLINDDVGAFMQIPMMMGRGAGLAENLAFWTLWLDTNQKDEGGSTAFWATTHTVTGQTGNANYMSGGTTNLSSTALTAAVLLFDKQVDPAGNPLGIDPEILLYGSDLDTTARELMNSEKVVSGNTTKGPDANVWRGRFTPLKSKYINRTSITGYSATAWWLLGNPSVISVIERAYLNGQEFPTVQTAGPDFNFNTLGMSMRAYFAPGVNMQNYRGGVKSAGA